MRSRRAPRRIVATLFLFPPLPSSLHIVGWVDYQRGILALGGRWPAAPQRYGGAHSAGADQGARAIDAAGGARGAVTIQGACVTGASRDASGVGAAQGACTKEPLEVIVVPALLEVFELLMPLEVLKALPTLLKVPALLMPLELLVALALL